METTSENIIKAYNIARETGAGSTCKVLEALYPEVDFNPKDYRPVTELIDDLMKDKPNTDNTEKTAEK